MTELLSKIKDFFIKNSWIIVFLLAVPFFNEVYPPMTYIYDYIIDDIKVIAMFIMIGILIYKKKKPSLLFFSLLTIEGWWVISTFLNYPYNDSTSYSVFHKLFLDNVNALSMGLLVECFMDDPKNLIKGLMLNFELALYPDLVEAFIRTARDNQLLGYYSVIILWTLPALCVLFLNMIINKHYIRSICLLAAILAITIRTWCATIVVAFLGFFGVIFLGFILTKIKKLENYKLHLSFFVTLAILLNVFVLFVYTEGTFPFIDVFIEKFLRRSTSFTERVVIWQEAMRMISEKPIIGHGFRPEVVVTNSTGTSFIHSHNQLLQRLNATGIIGLITFVIFHILVIKKVDESPKSMARDVMIGGVFGVCITYITEGYKKFFRFYLVFFLAYHIAEIVNRKISNTDYLLK